MNEPEREDRRAASKRRGTDIKKTDWPVTSAAAYQSCLRKADAMTPKMRSLCLGRVRVGHALLAIDKALHDHNPALTKNESDRTAYNRLRAVRDKLEAAHKDYPLVVGT